METQQTPSPGILPQAAEPEMTPEMPMQPTLPNPPRNLSKTVLPIVMVAIVVLIILLISTRGTAPAKSNPTATTSSSPTPSGVAASNRTLSPFATESAFMQFESSVDALPKVIQGAVLQDQTVLPPVIDLPLGF